MNRRIALTCPNCNKNIGIFAELEGERVIIEAFSENSQTGELYAPRGKWETQANKLEKTISFLLDKWAVLVKVYDLNGRLLNQYASKPSEAKP